MSEQTSSTAMLKDRSMTTDSSHAAPLGHAAPTRKQRWQALPAFVRSGSDETVMTSRGRLVAAALVLLSLVVGLGARAVGANQVSGIAYAAFMLLGPGIALTSWLRPMNLLPYALYSVVFGFAINVSIGFVMAETHLWWPIPVFAVFAIVTTASILLTARRELTTTELTTTELTTTGLITTAPARPRHRPAALVVPLMAVVGLAVSGVDAYVNRREPEVGGLLSSVGPLWFVGCALMILAFAGAVWTGVSLALPVMSAATVVVLSQALMYSEPAVIAAARHVGVMLYINANGGLTPSSDIYQSWPALFAGSEWVTRAAGIGDPMTFATWWPVFVSPVLAIGIRVLAGRFVSPRRAWIAAAVFTLGNSLNITYFSPQAFGLLLALAVLSLVVAPYAAESFRTRRLRLGAATILILVIVVTHQITPLMLVFALLALVVFRVIRPWWLPLVALVPTIAWALINRGVLGGYLNISAFGKLFGNIAPPDHPAPAAPVASITHNTFYVPAAALIVFGIIAVVTLVRRRDRTAWALAAAMVSPVALAVGTDYGQEGIFRVALFALPWLAILVACSPWRVRGLRAASTIALTLAFAIMLVVNTIGQTGLDWARVLRPSDVAADRFYESTAPAGAVLMSIGTKNGSPDRSSSQYLTVGYSSREELTAGFPKVTGAAYDPATDLVALTAQLEAATTNATKHYLLTSDTIGAYDDRYGFQTYADYLRLVAAVKVSPLWKVVYTGATASVYELVNDPGKTS